MLSKDIWMEQKIGKERRQNESCLVDFQHNFVRRHKRANLMFKRIKTEMKEKQSKETRALKNKGL